MSSHLMGRGQQADLPRLEDFARSCRSGLASAFGIGPNLPPDAAGWRYGQGFPPSYPAFGRMRALLTLQMARGLHPRRVLEVAAGGGGLSHALAGDGCEVVANDLRAEQLASELSQMPQGHKVRVAPGNLFELSPEALGPSDLVIACEVIEHVAHPDALLRHLSRFVAPGGALLLTTPNGGHFRNRLPSFREVAGRSELESAQFKPDADGHLFLFRPRELTEVAHAAGLQAERLLLWGTPVLTGHVRLHRMSGSSMVRAAYESERWLQRVPATVRERLAFAIAAVLRRS